jgi:hypothetical protein
MAGFISRREGQVAASVNVARIGPAEKDVELGVRELFKDYPSGWTANLLGDACTTFLVFRVTNPRGEDEIVHQIYKEDGNTADKIMAAIKKALKR